MGQLIGLRVIPAIFGGPVDSFRPQNLIAFPIGPKGSNQFSHAAFFFVKDQVFNGQQRVNSGGVGHSFYSDKAELRAVGGDVGGFFGAAPDQAGKIGSGSISGYIVGRTVIYCRHLIHGVAELGYKGCVELLEITESSGIAAGRSKFFDLVFFTPESIGISNQVPAIAEGQFHRLVEV